MGSIMLEFIGDIARNVGKDCREKPLTTVATIILITSGPFYLMTDNMYALPVVAASGAATCFFYSFNK